MKDFKVVIPARYESSRLPGKALELIRGKPMIQWVVERALHSKAAQVFVATDDERIASVGFPEDVTVVLTSKDHLSGTDRVYEVAKKFNWSTDSIVVNLQGDEPLIPPKAINQVARLASTHTHAGVSTLYEPLYAIDELLDINVVKLVCDINSAALYFSRAPIPFAQDERLEKRVAKNTWIWKRHIGLYAYRVWALRKFTKLEPSMMEFVERLEQLRFLENGIGIVVELSKYFVPAGVDTQEDLDRIREKVRSD